VMEADDVQLFESIANRLGNDDVLFGSPRWLENFREMKQAAIDPLYKDCLKHWTALRFNLQMMVDVCRCCNVVFIEMCHTRWISTCIIGVMFSFFFLSLTTFII